MWRRADRSCPTVTKREPAETLRAWILAETCPCPQAVAMVSPAPVGHVYSSWARCSISFRNGVPPHTQSLDPGQLRRRFAVPSSAVLFKLP